MFLNEQDLDCSSLQEFDRDFHVLTSQIFPNALA